MENVVSVKLHIAHLIRLTPVVGSAIITFFTVKSRLLYSNYIIIFKNLNVFHDLMIFFCIER